MIISSSRRRYNHYLFTKMSGFLIVSSYVPLRIEIVYKMHCMFTRRESLGSCRNYFSWRVLSKTPDLYIFETIRCLRRIRKRIIHCRVNPNINESQWSTLFFTTFDMNAIKLFRYVSKCFSFDVSTRIAFWNVSTEAYRKRFPCVTCIIIIR